MKIQERRIIFSEGPKTRGPNAQYYVVCFLISTLLTTQYCSWFFGPLVFGPSVKIIRRYCIFMFGPLDSALCTSPFETSMILSILNQFSFIK